MRLLELTAAGGLCLSTFNGNEIPPYAILSHTWQQDEEEVTFQDLISKREKDRAGYRKIQFCREKALEDGISYIWVDTCCIDKSSSAELSEALNSMFRWYQNAARCYVYLSDVAVNEVDPSEDHSQSTWDSSFRNCRWFTRGWTLQELLAPKSVHFISRDGELLGDKTSLETQVHDATGIPIAALRGADISTFSVEERLRWQERRQTKRSEDKAYSLLGLFDVFMPIIYGEGEQNAFRRLRDEITKIMGRRFCNIPFQRHERFVGREDLLAQIGQTLDRPGNTVALCGLGGVGKSQIAIEYAYRARNLRPDLSVFWVQASSMARFEQSYRDIADLADIPGREDSKVNIYQLVRDWLQHRIEHPWILVVDNLDDFELHTGIPFNYLPRSKQGTVVITSRDRLVVKPSNVIEVGPMNREEACELLHSSMLGPIVDQDASQLVAQLEGFPLAIAQAAAYISRRAPRYSIRTYLEDWQSYERSEAELLGRDFRDLRRDATAVNSLLTTWDISFAEIRRRRPSAAYVLSLMSFFDPDGIPAALIRTYQDDYKSFKTGVHGAGDDEVISKAPTMPTSHNQDSEFEEDILMLREYSLVSTKLKEDEFTMHRLVRHSIRNWLDMQGEFEDWQEKSIAILAEEFPPGNYENWARCQQLYPHAKAAAGLRPNGERSRRKWATLLYNVAWYDLERGLFVDAEAMSVQSMTEREKILGPEHPKTLESMAILGLVRQSLGQWKDAEQLQIRVMGMNEVTFGSDHPSTLIAKNNLASTYLDQGRWEEAENIQEEVMEKSSKVLGNEHPDTLNSMANLALTYKMLGQTERALTLYSAHFDTTSKVLGPEHPETLASKANLATTFAARGQLSVAEHLASEAFASREKILGPEHPDTIASLSNLASIYRDQGKLTKARVMETRVLEVTSRISGEEHPDTLTSMSNLAVTCSNLGRRDEAGALQARAMELSARVLGDEHPSTLRSMSNLAATFTDQGRLIEAVELQTRLVSTYGKILGEYHPDTLVSMHNLAFSMHETGQHEESSKIYRKVMEAREKSLGPKHPSTLNTMANLAVVYEDEGKLKDAESLLTAVVESRIQILGEHHPSTLSSTANLASVYRKEGQFREAEELGLHVMVTRKKLLGTEHPDTLSSMHNVALTKKDLGQLAGAIKLMEECVGWRVKTLGSSHTASMSSLEILAQWKQEESKSGSLLGVGWIKKVFKGI